MVFVVASTETRKSAAGALGAGWRQPAAFTALQGASVITETRFSPPTFTT